MSAKTSGIVFTLSWKRLLKKLLSGWKPAGALLTISTLVSCANSPQIVPTIAPACETLEPIDYALRPEGEKEAARNLYDTEETAIAVYNYNEDLKALCQAS